MSSAPDDRTRLNAAEAYDGETRLAPESQLHTEVRMARQVSHANVCRVYDIDDVDRHTLLSDERPQDA